MNFKRLAIGVDTAPLLAKIAEHPQLWETGHARQQYPGSAHAAAEAIILRWATDRTLEGAFRCLECEDLDPARMLMPEVARITNNVYDRVGFVKYTGRSMITRLPPGGRILPHMDEGLYADVYDRFHVCLDADEGSIFRCGTETVHMAPGDIWWFNHKREHEVINGGARPRIHLILDLDTVAYKELRGLYYQAERLSDLWDEMRPLLELHWREVAHYQDIELEPDVDAYADVEAAGQMRLFTARDRGRLVGYAAFFVRPSHHYASSLQALQDVLYLHPDYRRGRAGATLIRVAETRLRAEGVQVVYHHAKRISQVGELLERLGYELVDEIYAKRLDKKKGA